MTAEEWSLVVPYLTLMKEDAPQREYPLRALFNALRYVIRYGIACRAIPNDFPPWHAVHQQAHRWLAAGCFDALAQDLRAVLRLAAGRMEEPTAAIIDSRALRSTPESGNRAGYDGAKRKRGSKVHRAVGTLGHLLALHVLRHSAIKAVTEFLKAIEGPVVAGVQFGGMRPLCLAVRDPVPSPMTVGSLSAAKAEPNVIVVKAICETCAALPLDVLQADCQAAFAEWIKDLRMVKDIR